MNSYVTDTMALILRLEKRKSPTRVKNVFKEIERGRGKIIIPVMVLAEIGYLSERARIETHLGEVKRYCRDHPNVKIQPITGEIIEESFTIDDIPELHDRIIAGTAKHLDIVLITNDPMISGSKHLTTFW